MLHLVFVSPWALARTEPETVSLIHECSDLAPTWFLSPGEESIPSASLNVGSVELNRPLELQGSPALEGIRDRRVALIALHSVTEPALVSRRHLNAWIQSGSDSLHSSRGVALAARCCFIAGDPIVATSAGIRPDTVMPTSELTAAMMVDRLESSEMRGDRSAMHEIISGELFRRYDTARAALPRLETRSQYMVSQIRWRAGAWEDGNQPSAEGSGTSSDVSLDPMQVIRSEVGTPNERWPALESLTRIHEAESSGELLTDELEQAIENGPQWLRLARATRFTALIEEDGTPQSAENLRRVWQGLSLAQLMWTVTPRVIEILIGDPATSTAFLNRLVHGGSQFVRLRLSLELLLRRHRDGEELLSEEFDEIVSSIDEKAAHQPLWTAGLDYWEKMTGSRWAPSDKRHEPPLHEGSIVGEESIQESDTRARQALAKGEFETAIRLFERVRAMCLATEPPITTTEQAARLNLAWALWKLQRPQSEWEPHILSVIEEVAPPHAGLIDLWSKAHKSRDEAGM